MQKVLKKDFFNRRALAVAPDLLGKFLVKKSGNKQIALMITEVEAYEGFKDKASHAHKGKTKRNEVMFGPAGHWYVYLVYGMHYMLNIVVDRVEHPAAVLIRGGVLPRGFGSGKDIYSNVRTNIRIDKMGESDVIINGPGKLTEVLRIDKKLNTILAEKKSGLWVEDRNIRVPKVCIKKTPRIGVGYAQEWVAKPYRFVLEQHKE